MGKISWYLRRLREKNTLSMWPSALIQIWVFFFVRIQFKHISHIFKAARVSAAERQHQYKFHSSAELMSFGCAFWPPSENILLFHLLTQNIVILSSLLFFFHPRLRRGVFRIIHLDNIQSQRSNASHQMCSRWWWVSRSSWAFPQTWMENESSNRERVCVRQLNMLVSDGSKNSRAPFMRCAITRDVKHKQINRIMCRQKTLPFRQLVHRERWQMLFLNYKLLVVQLVMRTTQHRRIDPLHFALNSIGISVNLTQLITMNHEYADGSEIPLCLNIDYAAIYW